MPRDAYGLIPTYSKSLNLNLIFLSCRLCFESLELYSFLFKAP